MGGQGRLLITSITTVTSITRLGGLGAIAKRNEHFQITSRRNSYAMPGGASAQASQSSYPLALELLAFTEIAPMPGERSEPSKSMNLPTTTILSSINSTVNNSSYSGRASTLWACSSGSTSRAKPSKSMQLHTPLQIRVYVIALGKTWG